MIDKNITHPGGHVVVVRLRFCSNIDFLRA